MAIRWPLTVRRVHRWIALLVGVQVVLWTLTGFYMVAVHIDTIHGDALVRHSSSPRLPLASLASPMPALAGRTDVEEVRLIRLLGRPVWRVQTAKERFLLDASSGSPLPPPSPADIRQIARATFTGVAPIVSLRRLDRLPQEVQTRKAPLWQIEFAGWNRPTFYADPATGEIVSRRHALWRVFDFAWMLHIMDYDARENVNNPLLRIATLSAAAMAMSGAWLLYWSFPRKKCRLLRKVAAE